VKKAKSHILSEADKMFAQTDAAVEVGTDSEATTYTSKSLNEIQMEKLAAREYTPEDLKKMAVLQTEIEEVYNFERDVATAKVQDPTFDAAVSRIND
jgi:hypothetical protein